MDYLDNDTNKIMAMVIIQNILKNYTCISTADQVQVSVFLIYVHYILVVHRRYLVFILLQVEALFELIKGLIKDIDGSPVDEVNFPFLPLFLVPG